METFPAWQDLVFTFGQLLFVVALVPSIISADKPALSSSLMTGTILAIFGATYASMGLWWSAASSAVIAGTWFVLATQTLYVRRKKH